MEALHDPSQTCQIRLSGRYLDELGLAGELKKPDGFMIRPVAELIIEIPINLPDRKLQAPPDIVSKLPQGLECRGKLRNDVVGDGRIHGARLKSDLRVKNHPMTTMDISLGFQPLSITSLETSPLFFDD